MTDVLIPPEIALADGFAARVARWAEASGAPTETLAALRGVARAVSLATDAGHVCADLAEIAREPGAANAATLRDALLASTMAGTPEFPRAMPLIVDADGRVYLHRYFDYERRLARRLHASPLTIISGGPGTGKTTMVAKLIAQALIDDPACRIALAAPTGKAAARMQEALLAAASGIPEALRPRFPVAASTIHRLLGVLSDRRAFRHHAGNPLPVDLLVIDEASMLDLALATKLLEAMPRHSRVILLGDKDQLAAVESGAVFAELSAQPGEHVVWLTENFRFAADSSIGRLAAHVRNGDVPAASELLRAGNDPALRWIEDAQVVPAASTREAILAGITHYVQAARAPGVEPAELHAAFARFRVLCAERNGPRGVMSINALLAQAFREAIAHPLDPGPRSDWFPGRPVMVLRNEYVLKLYNGDVGVVWPDATGALMVYFPEPGGGLRAVSPLRLPEHETAFAMTVHKAQGSEFDDVLLLLPPQPTRVVTRELVYTAVTRARRGVTIVGSMEVVETAVRSPTRRYSGLIARLAEAQRSSLPAQLSMP